MGRKRIGIEALTGAQRMRRYRLRLKLRAARLLEASPRQAAKAARRRERRAERVTKKEVWPNKARVEISALIG